MLDGFLNTPARSRPHRVSFVRWVGPGESVVLAELVGPGKVTCISVIIDRFATATLGRSLLLRAFWDDEETPSVESPVTDFFGVGHGEFYYPVNNAFFSAKGQSGYTCYLPMPFSRSARFELTNTADVGANVYVFLDWGQYDQPLEEEMRLHAKWRREYPAPAYAEDYEIVDVLGRGRLLGYSLSLSQFDTTERWSHAGAERIYIDGRTTRPMMLRGGGGEDAFGVGFGGVIHEPESHLYTGMPLYTYVDRGGPQPFLKINGYRFFVAEEYYFEESLHMRFGSLGNEISSVAYWYQAEPHHEFFALPSASETLPGHPVDGPRHRIRNNSEDDWLVLGAFPSTDEEIARLVRLDPDTSQAFEVDWPASIANIQPDPPGSHPRSLSWATDIDPDDPRAQPHWREWRTTGGFVDFNHAFPAPALSGIFPGSGVVATAFRRFTAAAAGTARLTVSYDDRMLVRVNGGPPVDLGEHSYFASTHVDVDLVAGENLLQCILTNTHGHTWGGWAFAVNIDHHGVG